MALVALILAIVANYEIESTNLRVNGLENVVATKADKTEVAEIRTEIAKRLATKADKTELEALARRSVVDKLAEELNANATADSGRTAAIAEIRSAMGAKADEERVKKLERRLRRRINRVEIDVDSIEAILTTREGGAAGPPPEPKKYIIP